MRAQIGKWGNSLALRLPKEIAAELRVDEGTTVDIEVERGVLKVAPAKPRYSLDELLKGIEPGNIPDASLDDGPKGWELL